MPCWLLGISRLPALHFLGIPLRPHYTCSTQIKPPKGKGKGKATASQEFDADGERLSTNPAFDLADRDSKSERFNNLKPGDHVIICNNQRTGHHDVTGKRAYLNNKVGGVSRTIRTWYDMGMAMPCCSPVADTRCPPPPLM